MAKNQEFLIFFIAFSFTAEKRMLMELWLQRLNTDFCTKRANGRASLASPLKLFKYSKNSISEDQRLSIVFSAATTYFFSSKTDFFRIDVVQRSSVVLHFW